MKTSRAILILLAVGAVAAAVILLRPRSQLPVSSKPPLPPSTSTSEPLRLGLVPEYDVFAMRRSYRLLADYLAVKLGRPVEIVTPSSYETVLDDFRERQIDGAFLGSLVAHLAMQRYGAQVLVKPERPDGLSTYRAVIFVRDQSAIGSIADIAGHSIALVRTTTAGDLFPVAEMVDAGILHGPQKPRFVWMGTHDNAIEAVVAGQVDAGAAKDLRLTLYEKSHPDQKFRRLTTSAAIPNNALIVRGDVAERLGPALQQALLEMGRDPKGQPALDALGIARFVVCAAEEYRPVQQMIDRAGAEWEQMGTTGPPPAGQATRPASKAAQP